MSTTVEQIKQRLSIVDVVESYIKLDQAGSNLKGKCPFHNEKTPSFFVSPERGTFYCFGCSAKGDIFEFVEKFEGLDFMGALKSLAQRAGVEIVNENPKARTEKERLYGAMEDACKYYESLLHLYPEARDYLHKRGLKDETIKEFRIGFVPDEWRKIHAYLMTKGYSELEIEKVGLIKKTEKGYYDRFRGRIMFPIADSGGRVIAFSGRILVDDGKSAKYLNSPDTVLFNKSSVLYGIDKAKGHIRRMGFTTLVEGQMDLIMSHQAGYNNTVAVSGTALTDSLVSKEDVVNNLGVVRRLSENMILAFDSDKAGFNAASRAAQIGLSLGMDIKIASVPKGKDPADFILEDAAGWKEVLKSAVHVIDFHLNQAVKESTDHRKIGKYIREKVLPYVAALRSHMEQAHFVSKIREKLGIDEAAIWEDLKKVTPVNIEQKAPSGGTASIPASLAPVKRDSVERKIAGIVFWQEQGKPGAFDTAWIREEVKRITGEDTFFTMPESDQNELIFEAEIFYGSSKVPLEKSVKSLLCNFEIERVQKRLIELSGLMRQGQDLAATQEFQKLSQHLDGLKQNR